MDDKLTNGMDTQSVLDDTESTLEKLVKTKRRWTGIAVFWFIVWLLIIMYMFYFFTHRDTVKPIEPTPIATEESTPTPDTTESIDVYEYNLTSVGVSVPFTDNLFTVDAGGYGFNHEYGNDNVDTYAVDGAYRVNDSALTAYDESYSISWEVSKGDDNFTAERSNSSDDFATTTENKSSITGLTNLGAIYGGAVEGYENVRPLICITEKKVSKGINAVAVVLPESTSDEEIEAGVSTFLEKVNAMNIKFSIADIGSYWNMNGKTIEDFKSLLGESFSSTGYILSSTDEDDISIAYTNEGLAVKSLEIKDGDKVVYINLERFYLVNDMHGHTSAAFYSKYLQGDSSFEVFSDITAMQETLSKEYNQ